MYFADSLIREFSGMYIGLSITDAYHIVADMATGEMNYKGKIRLRPIEKWIKNKFDFPPQKRKKKNNGDISIFNDAIRNKKR